MNATQTAGKVIRLGIVGGGGVGGQTIGIARSMDGVETVAVVESFEARRKVITEQYGIPAFATIDEMVEKVKLDAVKVCTPNHLHGEHAAACLNAGLHVLCEKPLATSVTDGQKIIDAAVKNKKILIVNFEYRWSLLFQRVKQIIESGEIGKVVNIHFKESRGAFHGKPGGWRFDQKLSGGTFVEKYCHYMDLAVWFSGQHIKKVHALSGKNTLPHYQVVDNIHAFFELENDVSFSLTANHAVACDHPMVGMNRPIPLEHWARLGHDAGFAIAGTKGSIVTDDWRLTICVNKLIPNEKRGGYQLRHQRIEDFTSFNQHKCIHDQDGMLVYFIDKVREGKPVMEPDAGALLNVLAASLASEEAMAQRIPVDVGASSK